MDILADDDWHQLTHAHVCDVSIHPVDVIHVVHNNNTHPPSFLPPSISLVRSKFGPLPLALVAIAIERHRIHVDASATSSKCMHC